MSDHTETRQRLIETRTGLLADMDRQIEAGHPTLLAGISGALAAIDGEAEVGELAARAVVSDDGEIRLTLFIDNRAVAAIDLDAGRAVSLAGGCWRRSRPSCRPRHGRT